MKVRQSFGVVVLLCAFAVGTAWAHFPVEVRTSSDDGLVRLGWTPLQVGVFPVYPLQAVSGDADVYGIAVGVLTLRQESAIVSASLENGIKANYLAQVGLACSCEWNCALEAGLFSFTKRNLGVSAGLLNIESNYGERSSDPCPRIPGLQIGLFNAGGGIQIGLLNYNPQGFLPWFPLFNVPWRVD